MAAKFDVLLQCGGGATLTPRTPVMVLILLQAIDARQVGDLAQAGYVRYYKFLIDTAILRTATREEAELSYAFLPEVAWAMFRIGAQTLRANDLEQVIDDLGSRRALRKTSLYGVLGSLMHMGMFEEHRAEYKFKHRYVYYFFLADHLSRNLTHSDVRNEVERLCREITVKENADILNFLSFHTDSDLIINLVTDGLSQCYREASEFELSKERLAPVNQLIYELPKEVVDRAAFNENRRRRLDTEDKLDRNSLTQRREADDRSVQLRIVFNAVEVLGHILRNHYARLDAGPKLRMLEVATGAILRCLGDTFDFLSKNIDSLMTVMETLTNKLHNQDKPEKRETAAKRLVFSIVVAFTYYVVRTLVRSVGDENLSITYQQVMKDSPEKMREYVRLAIELDCFHDFPIDDLKKLPKHFAATTWQPFC
jgi:hypothetical protein